MNNQHRPYQERVALPTFFFPFLSPNCDKATQEDIDFFYQKLNERCTTYKKALLYVHIPFCDSLCHFCAFYRVLTPSMNVIEEYIKALKREMQTYSQTPYVRSLKIESIYFGGGSPSVLPPKVIDDLLFWTRDCFNLEPNIEFTYEGEIRTLKDKERLKVIYKNGCNRVSFGIQTFDREARRQVGLVPSFEEVIECIRNVGEMGYDINVDLMYGLPGQTMSVWKKDLSRAVELGVANIDIYDTILYPTSRLFQHRHNLKKKFPDEDTRIEMFRYALNYLKQEGYFHETIEDFSLPDKGYQMKKLLYGGGDGTAEIIGIGVNSIGFLSNIAYRNSSPLRDYVEWFASTKQFPIRLSCKVTSEDIATRVMVYLSKLLKIGKRYITKEVIDRHRNTLNRMQKQGLIEENDSIIKLTDIGVLWADNIATEFLEAKQKQKMWKVMY